jgi:hypothetical protein
VVAAFGGLALGGAALVGRAFPMPAEPGTDVTATAMAIVTEPLTAALLTFAVTGMLLYAHALQHGQVGPVTAVHWTAEVLAPSAVALVFLGDMVRPGWELPAAIAGLVTAGAAVLLATAPATDATVRPPEALPAGPAPPALPTAARPALTAAPLPVLSAAPRPLFTAAPLPVVPAGVLPALPAGDRYAERVIWWGPPPIWKPPSRTGAVPDRPRTPEPTWNSPHRTEPAWARPHPADARRAEIPEPATPAPAVERVPSGRRPRPWDDL